MSDTPESASRPNPLCIRMITNQTNIINPATITTHTSHLTMIHSYGPVLAFGIRSGTMVTSDTGGMDTILPIMEATILLTTEVADTMDPEATTGPTSGRISSVDQEQSELLRQSEG